MNRAYQHSSSSQTPRVSVVTTVYNGERFLDEAIATVLTQSFSDFEYILVDDASVDGSSAIMAKWAASDGRIRLLHNPRNLKAPGALNRGFAEARGEYIALLDQDDLAFPTRLSEEVAFLDTNPGIGLVGSQALIIDGASQVKSILPFPTTPQLFRWTSLFVCPALQSTVLVRRALVQQVGGYNPERWAASDHDFFHRLRPLTQMTNLPTTLGAYRRASNQQLTRLHARTMLAHLLLILQASYWELFGLRVAPSIVISAISHFNNVPAESEAALQQSAGLLDTLYDLFRAGEPFSEEEEAALRQDYAWRYLMLAFYNHHQFRQASRKLLARALELDPNLWANRGADLRNIRPIQRSVAKLYRHRTRPKTP